MASLFLTTTLLITTLHHNSLPFLSHASPLEPHNGPPGDGDDDTTNNSRSHAYSFDADASHRPSWMASLPDERNLSSLSIPGTHDTMTHTLRNVSHFWCQNHGLDTQLVAGMRYFDIRLRLRNDSLPIYHGSGDTNYSLPQVLDTMTRFLESHPSEALVVRVKDEGNPLGTNTISFEDAFARDVKPYRRILPAHDPARPLPSLGQVRGSIFLLQEFKSIRRRYGLEWDGASMVLEDWWIAGCKPTPSNNSHLYLSHISATGYELLPVEAAAGPANRSVSGLNDLTGHWLENCRDKLPHSRVGIVILDFPGRRAIDAVLDWNSQPPRSIRRRGIDSSC
ncbi:hypothetical protein L249_4030 [Ophiocordyceps polyrhachis-furcata BCC 54312]|uniref:Phosphatidylinositol-specific phospholipase C X domain-containing protein n=1 Tax=Ophiocordyceps polyrhachis-furcata BCC 54312 TaxID=1330021 RepID=A0A367L5U1_9HYPO|nr:hypothetical protein L249_4030 [Ophiocordyceps polyrhachis-furcata BCC 54312]